MNYVHNWSLQPLSQNYWPSFSHHLWHIISCMSGGTYSSKSAPNDRFFWQFLFTFRAFDKNLLRANRRKKKHFLFCFDVWPEIRTQMLFLMAKKYFMNIITGYRHKQILITVRCIRISQENSWSAWLLNMENCSTVLL